MPCCFVSTRTSRLKAKVQRELMRLPGRGWVRGGDEEAALTWLQQTESADCGHSTQQHRLGSPFLLVVPGRPYSVRCRTVSSCDQGRINGVPSTRPKASVIPQWLRIGTYMPYTYSVPR